MSALPLPLHDLHRAAGARFVTLGRWGGLEAVASYPDRRGEHSPEAEHRAVQESVGLVDQTYRGIVDVCGGKAPALLDRITSNHAGRLQPGSRGQAACILTAKGRLAGAFHIFRLDEQSYRVVLFEPTRDAFIRELRKYAFLEDVEVADRTGDMVLLSLQGPRADDLLQALAGPSGSLGEPALSRVSLEVHGHPVVAVRSASSETRAGGLELWVEEARVHDLWIIVVDALRHAGGRAVGWTALESLRIEAGFARYGMDYDEQSFPVEIGWDHALTYDKCYVGQEIVARMRTYGQVNRKPFQVLLPPGGERLPDDVAGGVPAPGTPLLAGAEEAGQITSSCSSFLERRPLALARIKRRFWGAELTLGGAEGLGPLEVRELPGQP